MTFVGSRAVPQQSLPSTGTKQRLPDIWQTLASSGLEIAPNEMTPFIGTVIASEAPKKARFGATSVCDAMPSRKRRKFKRTLFSDVQKKILSNWLHTHQSNPYPTLVEKEELMHETGLNREQINVWFTNNRIRHGLTGSHGHQLAKRQQVYIPEAIQYPMPMNAMIPVGVRRS